MFFLFKCLVLGLYYAKNVTHASAVAFQGRKDTISIFQFANYVWQKTNFLHFLSHRLFCFVSRFVKKGLSAEVFLDFLYQHAQAEHDHVVACLYLCITHDYNTFAVAHQPANRNTFGQS